MYMHKYKYIYIYTNCDTQSWCETFTLKIFRVDIFAGAAMYCWNEYEVYGVDQFYL